MNPEVGWIRRLPGFCMWLRGRRWKPSQRINREPAVSVVTLEARTARGFATVALGYGEHAWPVWREALQRLRERGTHVLALLWHTTTRRRGLLRHLRQAGGGSNRPSPRLPPNSRLPGSRWACRLCLFPNRRLLCRSPATSRRRSLRRRRISTKLPSSSRAPRDPSG